MEKYKIIGNISAGAHGIVLKAVASDSLSNTGNVSDSADLQQPSARYFAIKRIFIKKQHFSLSLVREIKSLQLLGDHPHVSLS